MLRLCCRMSQMPDHLTPERWLMDVFGSSEAMRGGVLRRKARDVERYVGQEAFVNEAHRRGWRVVRNHQHYVVFCNGMPIKRVRGPGEGG